MHYRMIMLRIALRYHQRVTIIKIKYRIEMLRLKIAAQLMRLIFVISPRFMAEWDKYVIEKTFYNN